MEGHQNLGISFKININSQAYGLKSDVSHLSF